jgi:hypothetical protein
MHEQAGADIFVPAMLAQMSRMPYRFSSLRGSSSLPPVTGWI